MSKRGRAVPLGYAIHAALRMRRKLWLLALTVPLAGHAQTFPTTVTGTRISTVTVSASSGNTQVQGGATLAPTSGGALTLNAGLLAQFNTQAGATPGPITVTTTASTGIQTNAGTVDVPYAGLTVNTNNGIGMLANSNNTRAPALITIDNGATVNVQTSGAALGAYGVGGSIEATGAVLNLNGGRGRGAVAQAGGTITLSGSSAINSTTNGTNINALALGAAGAGSTVTVTSPIAINLNSPNAIGVYMSGGGVVQLPANQVFNFNAGANAAGSLGMVVDGTQLNSLPTNPIGNGLTFHFNTPLAFKLNASMGVAVVNGGNVTLNGLVIDGANAAVGVWVMNGSSAKLSQGTIDISAEPQFGPDGRLYYGNGVVYTLNPLSVLLDPSSGSIGPIFNPIGGSPNAALKSAGGTIIADGTKIAVSALYGIGGYASATKSVSGADFPVAILDLTNTTIATSGAGSFGLEAGDGGQITGNQVTLNTNSDDSVALYLANYAARTDPTFINLTDSTVRATGSNTVALSSGNYTTAEQNSVTLTGTSLQSDELAVEAQGPLLLTVQ